MSVRLTVFLQSHLDYFPKNWGDLGEEQGECFHHDIHNMEEHCQGPRDVNFFADYCWCLKHDTVAAERKRKSLKRPFISE